MKGPRNGKRISLEDQDKLELEFCDGDCIHYETYYSPVTKKYYEIDLVLDDARKWETLREIE